MISFFKNTFNSILSYLGIWNKKANLLFLGLDNAGKTTLLHMLKFNKFSQFKQTDHPNSEELRYKNIRLNTFDLGGHETARKIWRDYFPSVQGILFLVDSTDVKRFPEVKKELQSLFETPELEGIPIAILGNKIDIIGAVSELEFKEALDLSDLSKDGRPMETFMISVAKKIGYSQALDWIANYIK